MILPQPAFWPIGLVLAVVAACAPQPGAAEDPAKRYICADGQPLDIIRTKDLAIVKLGERIFNLDVKPSSIGQRYTNSKATLIVDGSSAVFVTRDGEEAINCEVSPPG